MAFAVGETVRLTREALSMPKLIPAHFVSEGFPNKFTIRTVETLEDADTGKAIEAISLAECCGKIRNPETGKPLCHAHPADLFEPDGDPLGVEGLKPERETAIETPLGRILQLAHYRRESGAPTLILKLPFLGQVGVTGPWADFGAEKLKELGIL